MNISFLRADRFLHEEISNFTIEITQQCNCRCSYCCYSGEYSGMREHGNHSMEWSTMQKAIEFIKKHAHKNDAIVVSFFGGEALIRLNLVVSAIDELYAFFGDRILFDISTNGLLLTSKTIDQLIRYNIGISVSLDGCKTIHNKNRRSIEGRETYDQIVTNLLRFKERYPTEYKKRIRLLITVGCIDDLIEMNKSFAYFQNLLGDKPPFISQIYPNFKKSKIYVNNINQEKEFLDIAIEHKQKGLYDLYTIVLDELLKKSNKIFEYNESHEKICLRTCLDDMYSIFIDVDGKLYPCEKFDTCHVIGDIESGIDKKRLYKWSSIYNFRRSILCHDCEYVEYCTRCLADLKMSYSENKQMCKEYKKNIELALMYNKKLIGHA